MMWTWVAGLTLVLVALAMPSSNGGRSSQRQADAIRDRLVEPELAARRLTSLERAELRDLYAGRQYAPLWVGAPGRAALNARSAVEVLSRAAGEGLDPETYDAASLGRLAGIAGSDDRVRSGDAAFDIALSVAMLRYLRHVHAGRIDPRSVGFRVTPPADRHDRTAALIEAVERGRVAETAAAFAPQRWEYAQLRAALQQYRTLARDSTLAPPALRLPLHPGDRMLPSAAESLSRLLVALGDLGTGSVGEAPAAIYRDPLAAGVRRFQARHGLTVDGVIGTATAAALHVLPAARVRQIELALERLRWLPPLDDQRLIVVNIPMFRLWAWDGTTEQHPRTGPALDMRVIVGRATGRRTPVLTGQMRDVIFRPYWNVPQSIVRDEILPLLARDPLYLRRQDMEIVSGESDAAPPVEATTAHVDQLVRGQLRLRQRPGPQNALGLIKFIFPNEYDVYMHGTPARALFARARRDFSHGCIRVEDPDALAAWVLGDRPGWTGDRIAAATSGADNVVVELGSPIRVLIFYTTAAVTRDGAAMFAPDIYGHDAALDRALRDYQARTRPVSTWTKSDAG